MCSQCPILLDGAAQDLGEAYGAYAESRRLRCAGILRISVRSKHPHQRRPPALTDAMEVATASSADSSGWRARRATWWWIKDKKNL